MLRLDVPHLQMLTALSEAGSLARAATRLGVTPSALSHRIREAERRLDIVLLTRQGRRLALTPAGEILLNAARTILGELERAETDAQRISRGASDVVRLGLGAYSVFHWLPAFLRVLGEREPSVQLEIVAGAARRPEAALLDAEIDVAVLHGPAERAGLRRVPLFEDELVAIMSPGHPLAAKKFIEPEDLIPYDYFTYSMTPEPGLEYDRALRRAPAPRRITRLEQIEAIVELVKAGLGVSILTRWAMEPHVRAGTLACRRVTPEGIDVAWFAALRANESEESAPARVAAALADWCADPASGLRSMETGPVAPPSYDAAAAGQTRD
jgi:LysR family transcriptional regulator for metE and metH